MRTKYDYEVPIEHYFGTEQQAAEVFQPLYNTIANDLARHRSRLDASDIVTIRRVAELRFAADLAPEAFDGYLQRDDKGRYSIVRLPARDDQMYRRIREIRERDFMLIDTLSGHVDNFYGEMQGPYGEWRRARAAEAAALREVERRATTHKLLGVAAIAGAIGLELLGGNVRQSTGTLRNVMVVGGAYALKTGFDMDSETTIHKDAIEELGDSFASESRPLVVEVEGETHELTGSAEAQFEKWRVLLRRIYASETGLIEAAD